MKYIKSKYILDIEMLNNFNEIYIYGTGVSARKLQELMVQNNLKTKILGFIDTYKKTQYSDKINIININDFHDFEKEIIICTYYEEWIDEIVINLENNNIYNYSINMMILDPMYSLDAKLYQLYTNKIQFITQNLKSSKDKMIWTSVVDALKNNKNNKKLFDYYYNYSTTQYLDCVTVNKDDIVIEGGVFDGITTLKISAQLDSGKIYAFDPLIDNEKKELFLDKKITIDKKALWDKETTLYFVNQGAGSYVSDKEVDNMHYELKVDAINIDKFIEIEKLPKFDFLKLDVEGSELNVINGALNSIKKFRPKLAISIYHSLEDFFDIPYLLMSELKMYDFYMRLYSGALMDTVLYAIPKEKNNYL